MRAFLGISLSNDMRASLAALQRELAESHADVKWVSPAQLHITLKFLDEISASQRQAIEERLRQVARCEPSFRLGIECVGAFPSIHAPRVLWVGLSEGKERVAHLAASIEQELAGFALRQEERSFAAHLTIGRVRSVRHQLALVQRLRELSWQPPAAWPVTSLTLYQSVLSSSGPHYTVLAEFPLRISSKQ